MTSHQGVFISYYKRTRHAAIDITVLLDSGDCPDLRDWSLITGRGGLQNGKIAGPKLFAPPLQDRVKLFAPPLFKSGNFSCPPYNMAQHFKLPRKSYPKTFCAPPSAWLKLFPPTLFVGVKLHVPPPPVL